MANVETLGALERRVSMSLPAQEIEREVDERLRKLARNMKMPGFRPGKVPLKLVAQTYGPQVRSEVLSDAVQKAFSDAVKEANLRVAESDADLQEKIAARARQLIETRGISREEFETAVSTASKAKATVGATKASCATDAERWR